MSPRDRVLARRLRWLVIALAASIGSVAQAQSSSADSSRSDASPTLLAVMGATLRLDSAMLRARFAALANSPDARDQVKSRVWDALDDAGFNTLRVPVDIRDAAVAGRWIAADAFWASEHNVKLIPVLYDASGRASDEFAKQAALTVQNVVAELASAGRSSAHDALLGYELPGRMGSPAIPFGPSGAAGRQALRDAAIAMRSADSIALNAQGGGSPTEVSVRVSFDLAITRAGGAVPRPLAPDVYGVALSTVVDDLKDVLQDGAIGLVDAEWFPGTVSGGVASQLGDLARDLSAALVSGGSPAGLVITSGFPSGNHALAGGALPLVEATAAIADQRLAEGDSSRILGVIFNDAVDPPTAGTGTRPSLGLLDASTLAPRDGLLQLTQAAASIATGSAAAVAETPSDGEVTQQCGIGDRFIEIARQKSAELLADLLHVAVDYVTQRWLVPHPESRDMELLTVQAPANTDEPDTLPVVTSFESSPGRDSNETRVTTVLANPVSRPLHDVRLSLIVGPHRFELPRVSTINPGVQRSVTFVVRGAREANAQPQLVVTHQAKTSKVFDIASRPTVRSAAATPPRVLVNHGRRPKTSTSAPTMVARMVRIEALGNGRRRATYEVQVLASGRARSSLTLARGIYRPQARVAAARDLVTVPLGANGSGRRQLQVDVDQHAYAVVLQPASGSAAVGGARAVLQIPSELSNGRADLQIAPADIRVSMKGSLLANRQQLGIAIHIRNNGSAPVSQARLSVVVRPVQPGLRVGLEHGFELASLSPNADTTVQWFVFAPVAPKYSVIARVAVENDENFSNNGAAVTVLNPYRIHGTAVDHRAAPARLIVRPTDISVTTLPATHDARKAFRITMTLHNEGALEVRNAKIRLILSDSMHVLQAATMDLPQLSAAGSRQLVWKTAPVQKGALRLDALVISDQQNPAQRLISVRIE